MHVIQSPGIQNNSANHAPPTALPRPPPDTEDDDDGEMLISISVQGGPTGTGRPQTDEPEP